MLLATASAGKICIPCQEYDDKNAESVRRAIETSWMDARKIHVGSLRILSCTDIEGDRRERERLLLL